MMSAKRDEPEHEITRRLKTGEQLLIFCRAGVRRRRRRGALDRRGGRSRGGGTPPQGQTPRGSKQRDFERRVRSAVDVGVVGPICGFRIRRPSVLMRAGSVIRRAIVCPTERARSCERCQLEGKRMERIGLLSVCPVTLTTPGTRFSSSPMRARSG